MFSQTNPAPYQNFEFDDYQPKWKHVSLDSSSIGRYVVSGEDTLYNDGWSHISRAFNYSYGLIVNNSTIISVFPTGLNFIEGGFIEKLDIETGNTVWNNYFDLRNNDRKEWPFYSYIGNDNKLEILGFRQLYDDPLPLPNPLWLGARLSNREYDSSTGVLNNFYFADEFNSQTCRMANSFSASPNVGTYLFPYQGGYQYIEHKVIGGKIEISSKILNDSSYVITDTTYYVKYHYPKIERSKLFHVNKDSLLFMLHSKKVNDNEPDSMEFKLYWFDRNFNKLDSFNLSTDLPYSDNYDIMSTGNYSIIVSGIKNLQSNFVQFYSIFDFDGDLKETVYWMDDDNNPFLLGFPNALKLKYDKGSLFFSRDKQSGNWYLKIHKSDGNGSLTELKSLKVTPNNHEIDPISSYQLDNGDIILQCLDRNFDYYDKLEDPTAQVFIYFPAADLGLKTVVEDVFTGETKKMTLYPNPTSENLFVEFPSNFNGLIQITDVLGKIVLSKNIRNNSKITIDISKLTKGLYWLKAVEKEEKSIYRTQKFVVE